MLTLEKISTIAIVASVLSVAISLPGTVFAATDVISTVTVTASTTVATSSDPNAGVAAQVQSYFADIPVMIAIAKCESGLRQFKSDGTPLLGGTGTMVGVFQIDETTHYTAALALGFDINTVAGNLGYARYLYGAEGTEPWISSFGCWAGSATATTTVATTTTMVSSTSSTTIATSTGTPALTRDLSLGEIDPQVLVLQQMLNAAGFVLATSGPGSPGNETTKFGALTYAALKNFQCTKGIACSGEEATTGYGYLNAATRTALLAASSGTNTIAPADDSAEIAELQSRIAALVAIVTQLEAEIAARHG
jgi:hypothetical protein